jgi:hypothetical protein
MSSILKWSGYSYVEFVFVKGEEGRGFFGSSVAPLINAGILQGGQSKQFSTPVAVFTHIPEVQS